MDNLVNLISKHKLMLKKFLKSSIEIRSLDIDTEFDLLNQILDNREKQSKNLLTVFEQINKSKASISVDFFNDLFEENNKLLKQIIDIDKKNKQFIEIKKDNIQIDLNKISIRKNVINRYHWNSVKPSRLISQM